MNFIIKLPRINRLLQLGILIMVLKVSLGCSVLIPYNENVDVVLTVICVVIFTLVILLERYSPRLLILYAVISIASLYSVVITKQYGFLITILTCMAIRGEKFDSVIKHIYTYELLFFIIHSIMAVFWIILTGEHLGMIIGGRFRYKFGFGHPNTFSIYFFGIVLMWTWLKYETISLKHIGLLYLLVMLVFCFTYTRTMIIVTTALCILLILVRGRTPLSSFTIKTVGKYSTIICTVIILFLCFTYQTGTPVSIEMDALLNGRIKLGAYAYAHMGITWFGQPVIQNVRWEEFWRLSGHTYDCTYTVLAMEEGLIWQILLCLCFYKIAQKGDIKTCVFIVIWALYAITEVHPLNCYLSFPILFISQLLPSVRRYRHTTLPILQNDRVQRECRPVP